MSQDTDWDLDQYYKNHLHLIEDGNRVEIYHQNVKWRVIIIIVIIRMLITIVIVKIITFIFLNQVKSSFSSNTFPKQFSSQSLLTAGKPFKPKRQFFLLLSKN